MLLQKTIHKRVQVTGIGIHSGAPCTLTFVPAPPDAGIHFVRKDLPGQPSLKVSLEHVSVTRLATTLSGAEFSVATIEHCLSALSALRIDNLLIELDGPEIPISDGSAIDYLRAFEKVGLIEQDRVRNYLVVRRPFDFTEGDKRATFLPYSGLRLTVAIDFVHPAIGSQQIDLDINQESFTREIARARTFGFLKDIEQLHAAGLALGGSLKNAIVFDEQQVLNPEGLRWPDECVRHKTLDALGDLVTLGYPLWGHLILNRAGHDFMNKAMKALLASQSYEFREMGTQLAQ